MTAPPPLLPDLPLLVLSHIVRSGGLDAADVFRLTSASRSLLQLRSELLAAVRPFRLLYRQRAAAVLSPLALCPTGTRLAVVARLESSTTNAQLCVYPLAALASPPQTAPLGHNHNIAEVCDIAFDPSSSHRIVLLSTTLDGFGLMQIFAKDKDTDPGFRCVLRYRGLLVLRHLACQPKPEGQIVTSTSGAEPRLLVWKARYGVPASTLATTTSLQAMAPDLTLRYRSDGEVLAGCQLGVSSLITLWDAGKWEVIATLNHDHAVHAFCWRPNQTLHQLWSVSRAAEEEAGERNDEDDEQTPDHKLWCWSEGGQEAGRDSKWQSPTGTLRRFVPLPKAICFCPKGRRLAMLSRQSSEWGVWDEAADKLLSVRHLSTRFDGMDWNRGGRHVAFVKQGEAGYVEVWLGSSVV